MKLKNFLAVGIAATTFFCGNFSADAARYFMQGDAEGSSTPYGNNLSVGHYAQTADAKIYYEIYGEGKPIVVLHGGGVNTPYDMGIFIDELKKNYKVIAVTTRGHGRSEIGNTPLTYEQKANDIVAVLNETVNEPVQILGFSDGAYTAYKIAEMYPEKVERIVAIGAGTLHPHYFTGKMDLAEIEKVDKKYCDYHRSIMPEPERWQEFCNKFAKFWYDIEISENIFTKIKCPVLLVVGDEDDHAPVVTVLAAHQMIPNSRLAVIPKAWHSAYFDNYEATAAVVYPFINANLKDLQPSKKVDYNNHAIF